MNHYRFDRTLCVGSMPEPHSLCNNGGADENLGCNLTVTESRVECPRCLEILAVARQRSIGLAEARSVAYEGLGDEDGKSGMGNPN